MRDVKVGERVKIDECAAILREEEAELERLLAAKHAERIRVEEVARRFIDAEAQRRCVDMRRQEYGWILISGMAVPDAFDGEALLSGGEFNDEPGVPFVLYERVATPAGEARVFTPDRVDVAATLRAIGGMARFAAVIVEGLKGTIGDVKRKAAAIEAKKAAGKHAKPQPLIGPNEAIDALREASSAMLATAKRPVEVMVDGASLSASVDAIKTPTS